MQLNTYSQRIEYTAWDYLWKLTTQIEILCATSSVDEAVNRRLKLKIERMARVLDDKSLNVEPEEVNLDDDGLLWDDIEDFISQYK